MTQTFFRFHERAAKIISSEKPCHRDIRALAPQGGLDARTGGGEASIDHRMGFDGLLIEPARQLVPAPKTVRTDGVKDLSVVLPVPECLQGR